MMGEVRDSYIVKIVPVRIIGEPYTARARTHKKKRIDKKWLKRYGYVTKYRDDHKAIAVGEYLCMTKETYKMLNKMTQKLKEMDSDGS